MLPEKCPKCGANRSVQREIANYGMVEEQSFLYCVRCPWRVPEEPPAVSR